VDTMENAEFYKKLWKLQIPSKGKGFIWKLSHKRLPSKDNLQRRNILAGGSDTNCVFCNLGLETADHIFFECKFTYEVDDTYGEVRLECYLWRFRIIFGSMKVLTQILRQS